MDPKNPNTDGQVKTKTTVSHSKGDKTHLLTLMDDFIGQNWRTFTDFAEHEYGTRFEEEPVAEMVAEIKEAIENS
jgi:hypothetical protein